VPFRFTPTAIPAVVVVEPKVFGDERGFFLESYQRSAFAASGITVDFRQDNHSRSALRGTLRGLHFQRAPQAQGKLVRVLRGSVFDVAVDVRSGSPTYGRWVAETLDSRSHRMLWVPEGFAHGFQTLEDGTEVAYKTTSEYSLAHEGCIRWDDPALAIPWPVRDPILNQRDASAPPLAAADPGFRWG
jgi:dTDP-4-dehydrorhamnose 3,5-epimerase